MLLWELIVNVADKNEAFTGVSINIVCSFSKDRIPFLMHDNKGEFLKRTTNVTQSISSGNQVDISELRSLNAGKWFIEVSAVFVCEPHYKFEFLKQA